MENQFVTENKSGPSKTYAVFSVFVLISFIVGISLDIRGYAVNDSMFFIPIFLLPHGILFVAWLAATLSKKIKNPFYTLIAVAILGLVYFIFCYFLVLAIGSSFRNLAQYGTTNPSWEDQNIPRIK